MGNKNSFGQALRITLYGESHGEGVGVILDGLSAGIKVDRNFINEMLTLRRPSGKISTSRREEDEYIIQSGVFGDYTTGAPISIFIQSRDTRSRDYTPSIPRPSHADFVAHEKYHGFEDYRGGGHFSGRLTAALVAAGAIVIPALRNKGIYIATKIDRIGGVADDDLPQLDTTSLSSLLLSLSSSPFPVISKAAESRMKTAIENAAAAGDSVGGVLKTVIVGAPVGLGEPWFGGVENRIADAVFGIPAVKGIEFGDGFAISDKKGSEANDAYTTDGDRIVTVTNHQGGISGGISNGSPIVFSTAIKPTPSISIPQGTVDMSTKENVLTSTTGRHDPCIVHRARVVVDSVASLVMADLFIEKYGRDALGEVK